MNRPVISPYRITLRYGATNAPYSSSNPHNGTDYVSDDRKIRATHDATVTFAGWLNDKSGYMLKISDSKDTVSFSHIKKDGFRVKVGDRVTAFQHIADMGTTGFSTGVHVHAVLNGGTEDLEVKVKESDMHEGKTAKEWYDKAMQYRKAAIDWEKTARTRLEGIIKLEKEKAARDEIIRIKDNEIKRLQAELALVSEDTANLNKLGEILKWFVTRIGISKGA